MSSNCVRPGDAIEAALWFEPSRTGEEIAARLAIERAIAARAAGANAIVGPLHWEILMPGDRRLPDPPPNLSRDVECIVGYCTMIALAEEPRARRFARDLDPGDLARFRAVTRREWAAQYPGDPPLSDAECDDWIERYGPQAAANVVKRAFDAKAIP